MVLGETNEIRKKDYSQVSRRALHENYLIFTNENTSSSHRVGHRLRDSSCLRRWRIRERGEQRIPNRI